LTDAAALLGHDSGIGSNHVRGAMRPCETTVAIAAASVSVSPFGLRRDQATVLVTASCHAIVPHEIRQIGIAGSCFFG